MSWVWEHSSTGGNERLVLLAITDTADDNGATPGPGSSHPAAPSLPASISTRNPPTLAGGPGSAMTLTRTDLFRGVRRPCRDPASWEGKDVTVINPLRRPRPDDRYSEFPACQILLGIRRA